MSAANPSPLVYIALDSSDARHHDDLVRHLRASFAPVEPRFVSRRLAPGGAAADEGRERDLLRADIIVLLASASWLGRGPRSRPEVAWAVARHRARDAVVFAVHMTPCSLDRRLEGVPTIAPESFPLRNKELFWLTCATTIHTKWAGEPLARPRCDDQQSQALVEEISYLYWRQHLEGVTDRGASAALHRELRSGGALKGGDFLGERYWLLRRTKIDAAAWTWDAYDRREERPVSVRVLRDPSGDLLDRLRLRLRALTALEDEATVRTLTGLCCEREIDAHYFVTERARGLRLRDVVLDETIPTSAVLSGMAAIAGALAEGHAASVRHGALDEQWISCSGLAGGSSAWKLEWPILEAVRGDPASLSRSSYGEDIAALVRTIAFCLHGSALSVNSSKQEVREIINLQACPSELKALLSKHIVPEASRPLDTQAFARRYREVTRPARLLGMFAMDLEMCEVPGATFWLGARGEDGRARSAERPRHRVKLSSFEIQKYPVTQRLYESVMGKNPSAHQGDCCPVHNVSFRDALAFCNELSMRRGLDPAYKFSGAEVTWVLDADGYRLPTEAEWELAAKGTGESLFPWGDEDPSDRACWKGPGNALGTLNRKGPSPVWNHPEGATPSGIFDMAGGVWEWCWDWFAPYSVWTADDAEGVVDPIGPKRPRKPAAPDALEGERYRVLRGGAWNIEDPSWLRSTSRSVDREAARDPDIGFRLARGPKPGGVFVE
jgi:formylglycine-generating enzyme required for sulfatase activity